MLKKPSKKQAVQHERPRRPPIPDRACPYPICLGVLEDWEMKINEEEMNMVATRQKIEEWFDRGVAQNARHMLVVCDSFDHDDYPVFTTTDDECLQRYKNPGEMQRVMEVYDLRVDKAEQMNERRAMRLPEAANVRGETAPAAGKDDDGSH